MKTRLLSFLLALFAVIPLAHSQTPKFAVTADVEAYRDSIVRIISQNEKESVDGISYDYVTLDNGTRYCMTPFGSGTGFVINKDGYIVTNNHVAGTDPLSRSPNKLLLVVETITTANGKVRIAHKAHVVWQAPEYDIAVIQCSGLHCEPIPLDLSTPTQGDVVHSMGFPAMSDIITTNDDKNNYIQGQLKDRIAANILKKFRDKNGRDPTDDEAKELAEAINEQVDEMTQFTEFEACLAAIGDAVNPTWHDKDSWNITDVVSRNAWHNYFDATRTDGSIQNVVDAPSLSPDTQATFTMIQHSLVIQHGNSGGPLLSSKGGVLGVVGRGFGVKRAANDIENVNYAASVSELVKWMHSDPENRHYYKLVAMKTTLIYGVIAALFLAAAAFLVLGLVSKKPGLIPVAPYVSGGGSAGGMTMTQPQAPVDNNRTIPVSNGSASGGWKLTGRSGSNGRNFQVDFNDALFSRNGNRLIIGRSPDLCHLVLPTDDVSRQHSHIRKDGNHFFIADRNSSNRTAVNGQFTGAPFAEVSLREGDVITFGEVKVEFTRA